MVKPEKGSTCNQDSIFYFKSLAPQHDDRKGNREVGKPQGKGVRVLRLRVRVEGMNE